METKAIPQPLQNTLSSLTSIQRNTSNVLNETNESVNEARQDQDNDVDKSTSTVNLSSDSLKLSATAAAKNLTKIQPIENMEEANKTLSALLNGIQNNPSQALGSQSAMTSRVVKELLG
ncbi:MAG: hypothetical protein Q8N35_12140 [Methylococcaceae bacterium]|nr:hypothetical protein [Methylococcaceae bacterium]MDZ4158007.1 hypothetical protein [Methylococcales bacterium]MDP2392798.1 hypothetical protein [Methylococcaceae bacterium]MDP3020326.1 hypothetical protein [Methylococcaceae bacterium]MDP3391933.1 hypothetical protein [Methylococcaceae bacterium]